MTAHRPAISLGVEPDDPTGHSDRLIPVERLSRRRFFGAVGSTLALGIQGCSKSPPEDIVPYVHRPPEVIPGVARHYATSTTRRGYAFGLLVETHEGRPTKVEGHPEHPASLGRTGVREQASILTLYDPERAKTYRQGRVPGTFHEFTHAFGVDSKRPFSTRRGRGLALVLEPTTSPLVASLVDRLRDRYPDASVYRVSPFSPLERWEGARRLFGDVVEPHYLLESADVVLALDADFLSLHPMSVPLSRAFASRRKMGAPTDRPNRLYVVESAMTVTGGVADHRLAVAASEVGSIAAALLANFTEISNAPAAASVVARKLLDGSPHRQWISAVARDLSRHKGRVAVLVGDRQPADVHVLGYALASALDSLGSTMRFSSSAMPEAGGDTYKPERLLSELDGGDVDTLVLLGGNPAYALPWDARWNERVRKATERVHLSLFENETSASATWFLPETHYLEKWGDGRAYDGTVSFVQPLIRPLYDGVSIEEVLAALSSAGARRDGTRGEPCVNASAARRCFCSSALLLVLRQGSKPRR